MHSKPHVCSQPLRRGFSWGDYHVRQPPAVPVPSAWVCLLQRSRAVVCRPSRLLPPATPPSGRLQSCAPCGTLRGSGCFPGAGQDVPHGAYANSVKGGTHETVVAEGGG